MIKENIFIYEAIMSESSSLKFHLELLRLIPKNYSISSLELREKLLALGIERDLRSIQRALNTFYVNSLKLTAIPMISPIAIVGSLMQKA